ncbi:MAG: dTDP-4-dehydrorhamnose 3,5-epimerase [Pseudomonadota bacterium]
MQDNWLIKGAIKDAQSVTAEWRSADTALIEGVRLQEVKNVVKQNGFLTELYRRDWALDGGVVDQVFQVRLAPGGLSAWHAHGLTTDRLFVGEGTLKIVLYDGRQDSVSYRKINVFRCSHVRPMLIVIPPGVWHGVHNIGADTATLINMVDRAYDYSNPDHWRLAPDTPQIPYCFGDDLAKDALAG